MQGAGGGGLTFTQLATQGSERSGLRSGADYAAESKLQHKATTSTVLPLLSEDGSLIAARRRDDVGLRAAFILGSSYACAQPRSAVGPLDILQDGSSPFPGYLAPPPTAGGHAIMQSVIVIASYRSVLVKYHHTTSHYMVVHVV